MLISKIISGGQTGVDRGAIEAALELGFPYGGLIPKGRLAEDGAVPVKFDRMEVAPKERLAYCSENRGPKCAAMRAGPKRSSRIALTTMSSPSMS